MLICKASLEFYQRKRRWRGQQYSICRTKTRSKTKLGDWRFAVTEEKSVIALGGNGSCSPQVALHNQRGSQCSPSGLEVAR